LFYSGALSLFDLACAAVALTVLVGMNRFGVSRLWPFLLIGAVLWFFVLRSGVHATIAGVLLALTIPLRPAPAAPDDMAHSLLHQLEHALHKPVAFLVVPIFGFANAGVSFAGLGADAITQPLTLGVALGLLLGKLIGVFGASALAIRFGIATLPFSANWTHMVGVSLLCGIGFTMSLFIGLLAFADYPAQQAGVKIGILIGSGLAGVLGWLVLRLAPAPREVRAA
jgi:NhaA family Na+:H+ antiporter